MSFTELDKLKAAAIVNIFETGRPFGNYAAIAVLDDGAGISYGISQFTHRSGSLARVVERYLENGGQVARNVLEDRLGILRSGSRSAISAAAGDQVLKNALRTAAITREMRDAQHFVVIDRYLTPALRECGRLGFERPLSLAVIYDSMIHGSWEMIRGRVRIEARRNAADPEKAWITAYVKARHAWLRSIPRLRPTSYRTSFFLMQIFAANWGLDLPIKVHGYYLSTKDFPPSMAGEASTVAGHLPPQPSIQTSHSEPSVDPLPLPSTVDARPQGAPRSTLRQIGADAADLLARYDRIESMARIFFTRADAAKSLWTMVGGTIWQAFWAVAAFFAGLPRVVWLAVAVIAAAMMLAYLYRQFALGRIRELRQTALFLAERNGHDLPQENYE